MMKRPVPVLIIGFLLSLIGVAGFFGHLLEMGPRHAFEGENPAILVTELVALTAGVGLLLGQKWARWLALVWMAFHVAISFPDPKRVIVHSVFLALLAFFLFFWPRG